MDHPLRMSCVGRSGQGLDQLRRLAWRQRLSLQACRQAAALDPFHGEERPPFVLADLVDLHDVGMPHTSGQLRLQSEARHLLGGGEVAEEHHLQRSRPVQTQVMRLVDDSHAAAAHVAEDAISANLAERLRGKLPPRLSGTPLEHGPHGTSPHVRVLIDRLLQGLPQLRQQWIGDTQPPQETTAVLTTVQVAFDDAQVRVTDFAAGEGT